MRTAKTKRETDRQRLRKLLIRLFVRNDKSEIGLQIQGAFQEIVNAQIETMRKGAELLESLEPYTEKTK